MFRAPRLIFGGTGGLGSHFLVLRARTRFRRYQGRRVPFPRFWLPDIFSAEPRASGQFSFYALPDSFLAVRGASGIVFLFCAPGLIFGGTEGVGSVFILCAPGLVFGGTGASGIVFGGTSAVRGRPVFMFCTPESFSAVPRASGLVFFF
jgi:hypothetical protein